MANGWLAIPDLVRILVKTPVAGRLLWRTPLMPGHRIQYFQKRLASQERLLRLYSKLRASS
jgi:hypothetical protein